MKQTFVYVTTTFEFIHRYKDAPEEVSYLRNLHRHLAHIKVQIEVFHDDREIEFIILKHKLNKFLEGCNTDENCSCEMIADMLLSFMQLVYGTKRDMTITVSEDGENGVELVYRKEAKK